MANKRIDELTARTPLSTDLIPVADPATGIAGKAARSSVLGQEQLTATFNGLPTSWQVQPAGGYAAAGTTYYPGGLQVGNLEQEFPTSVDITCNLGNVTIAESLLFPSAYQEVTLVQPNLESVQKAGLRNTGYYRGIKNTLPMPKLKSAGLLDLGMDYATSGASTAIEYPELLQVGTFNLFSSDDYENFVRSVNLPKLKFAQYLTFKKSILTSVSLPLLEKTRNILFRYCDLPSSISLPTLTDANDFSILYCTGISSVSLPSIVNLFAFFAISNPITTVSIGSSLKKLESSFFCTGAALTQTSVNNILVLLASLDGTNGTTSYDNGYIDLSGGTSAAPSGAGLTAKATLVARGCTVTHN